MRIWVHFLVSLMLALVIYPAFNWKVIFIFIGGVLIDIDHYFWYVCKYREFNLYKSYRFYIEKEEKGKLHENIGILLIFHTIEFLLIMAFLSLYFDSMMLFIIGLVFHYLLDGIFLYTAAKRFLSTPSIIFWIVKNKIRGA